MSSAVKRSADHLGSSPNDSKKPKAGGTITSFFGMPKPKPSDANGTTATIKFDKAKWVSTLTAEQKELLKLEIDTLHESWLAHLKDELVTPEFLNLKRFLKKEKESGAKIFPPENDIYSWSRYTPIHSVKAVILGQDPYHNYNQAHGLCFSVRPPTPAPPSLQNIYICLKNDYPRFEAPPNRGGLLTPWAERGVLMLNACLTVRAHEANSHSNRGWERFTQRVIDTVARVRTHGVVFLAWGTPAAKRVAKVDRQKHCVLQSVHPSPLSARNGFFTNGHFKKCNEWLSSRYGPDAQIDWSLIPGRSIFDNGPQESVSEQPTKKPEPEKPATKAAAEAKEDDLDNQDDIDALEALAAAEAENPTPVTDNSPERKEEKEEKEEKKEKKEEEKEKKTEEVTA